MKRFKINLPYQVVGTQGSPSTLLLATALSCLAKREEDHTILETLVIDHVSDTTVNNICNNPMDLGNAIGVFGGLKNLVLSVKRQECRSSTFNKHLWFLIRKAGLLESLCMIGWNVRRDSTLRRHRHSVSFNDWRMRSLPYPLDSSQRFANLKFLELKRVDIDPHEFVLMILDCATTLKELYVIEVYIKVCGESDLDNISLWIGHPNMDKPPSACWVAQSIRNMKHLKLDILRASGIGYDDFQPNQASTHPDYDLKPAKTYGKSFDQRFVEAVLHPELAIPEEPEKLVPLEETPEENEVEQSTLPTSTNDTPEIPTSETPTPDSESVSISSQSSTDSETTTNSTHTQTEPLTSTSTSISTSPQPEPEAPQNNVRMIDYDAEAFQRYHNTTSKYKRSIDDYFYNHNEHALRELQNLINAADRGMALISEEIQRYRSVQVDGETGGLAGAGG